MATAMVIEHDEVAGLGWFGEWFDDAGLDTTIVRPHAGDPVPTGVTHDALVVLGGTMGANDDADYPWLTATKALQRTYAEREVPGLHLCLGHQLLAVAYGGVVRRNPDGRQLGVLPVGLLPAAADDPLLGGLEPPVRGVQWNDDVVIALPPDAVLLAETADGRPQAYRIGAATWGVQFHPEAAPLAAATWAALDYGGSGPSAARTDAAVRAVEEAADELRRTWSVVARRFAELAGAPVKPTGSISED